MRLGLTLGDVSQLLRYNITYRYARAACEKENIPLDQSSSYFPAQK
jgi:hypothetical protein